MAPKLATLHSQSQSYISRRSIHSPQQWPRKSNGPFSGYQACFLLDKFNSSPTVLVPNAHQSRWMHSSPIASRKTISPRPYSTRMGRTRISKGRRYQSMNQTTGIRLQTYQARICGCLSPRASCQERSVAAWLWMDGYILGWAIFAFQVKDIPISFWPV